MVLLYVVLGWVWVAPRDLSFCWAGTIIIPFQGESGVLDASGDLEARGQFLPPTLIQEVTALGWLLREAAHLSRSGFHSLDFKDLSIPLQGHVR